MSSSSIDFGTILLAGVGTSKTLDLAGDRSMSVDCFAPGNDVGHPITFRAVGDATTTAAVIDLYQGGLVNGVIVWDGKAAGGIPLSADTLSDSVSFDAVGSRFWKWTLTSLTGAAVSVTAEVAK